MPASDGHDRCAVHVRPAGATVMAAPLGTMTKSECVLAAVRHEAPDVIPQREGFMDEELAADFGSRHYVTYAPALGRRTRSRRPTSWTTRSSARAAADCGPPPSSTEMTG
ncbi:MAG: hypothetical protein HY332_15555 [Chloroflexi bacterium]|nr:hypothetical protein [Chloroflexota bacterium]